MCIRDRAAAEVAEGRARGKNVPPRGIPPLNVNGVTLHSKAPGGYPGGGNQLTPMPPAADKVWYKSALTPRPELLGQRKRLLVNAVRTVTRARSAAAERAQMEGGRHTRCAKGTRAAMTAP
eukprot:502255-Prymnesium_polylepis.1